MKIVSLSASGAMALSLFFLSSFLPSGALPQTGKAAATKALIDSQQFVFQAQTALPLSGRVRQLTTDNYTLKISRDRIISDLPYFGRAYVAPADPSQNGLMFTSADFSYGVTARKKGGWTILIKPKDAKDIQQLILSVSSDGYASLQVNSTERQSISFNGIITAPGK